MNNIGTQAVRSESHCSFIGAAVMDAVAVADLQCPALGCVASHSRRSPLQSFPLVWLDAPAPS